MGPSKVEIYGEWDRQLAADESFIQGMEWDFPSPLVRRKLNKTDPEFQRIEKAIRDSAVVKKSLDTAEISRFFTITSKNSVTYVRRNSQDVECKARSFRDFFHKGLSSIYGIVNSRMKAGCVSTRTL